MASVSSKTGAVTETGPQTLVVYGLVTNPATVADEFEQKLRGNGLRASVELSNRYAVLSPAAPSLRLCTPGWIEFSPLQMLEVGSTADLFYLCRERLINRSSPFSKPVRLFMQRYLEFVEGQLDSHKNELPGTGDESEIFDDRDWIFSAWLPLPQARILLPEAYELGQRSFAELDIAFWVNGSLIGILIDGGATPIKSKQRKLDCLMQTKKNFTLVRIPQSRLQAGDFPKELFPEPFALFWQGLSLPHGPCPADAPWSGLE